MPSSPDEIVVFVASPSDVQAERDLVARVAERVVATAGVQLGVRIRVTQWSEVAPDAGRPQDLINPLVDACDIFVGIMHKKWGMDSGTHSSGFEEEFERALKRRGDSEAPAIALFFKAVDAGSESDPGRQLKKVLAFKRKIQRDHVALYKPFGDIADFEREITDYLTGAVARHASRREKPSRASEHTSEADAAPAGGDSDGSNPARDQLLTMLDGYQDALHGRGGARDRDRLLLFALGHFATDNLPTHSVNRLFRRWANLELVVAEGDAWLRTLVTDWASTPEERVVPGWAVLGPALGVVDGIASLLLSENQRTRTGAVALLATLASRPTMLWPGAETDLSSGVPQPVVEAWDRLLGVPEATLNHYLFQVTTPDDTEFLGKIEDALGAEFKKERLAEVRSLLEGDYDKLVHRLTQTKYGTDVEAVGYLARNLDLLTPDDLRSLVSWPLVDNLAVTQLKEAAFEQLLARDQLNTASILAASASDDPSIRARLVSELRGDTQVDSALAAAAEGNEDLLTVLLAAVETSTELATESKKPLALRSWQALMLQDGSVADAAARELLALDKQNWLAAEESDVQGVSDSVLEFLYDARVVAAVEHIRRMREEARSAQDSDLVRRAAEEGDWLTQRAAANAMLEIGSPPDAAWLAELAHGARAASRDELLLAATVLGGPPFIKQLFEANDAGVIHSFYMTGTVISGIDEADLRSYLQHANAEVRMMAATALCATLERTDIEQLLETYLDQDTYYYNVVVFFDFELYGRAEQS